MADRTQRRTSAQPIKKMMPHGLIGRSLPAVRGWFVALTLAILLALGCTQGALAITLPDARIEAKARLTYQVGQGVTVMQQAYSNTVTAIVRRTWGLDLSGRSEAVTAPGSTAAWAFTVSNTGNVVDTYALVPFALTPSLGGSFTIFYDLNGNGRLDSADAPVSDSDGDGTLDTGPLSPEASLRLIAAVDVPGGTALGQHTATLAVTSKAKPELKKSLGLALRVSESRPFLELTGVPSDVYAGSNYTLGVHAGNEGSQALSGAIVRLALPAAVTFQSATSGGTYDPGSHRVTWNLGSLGASDERQFSVTVSTDAATATGTMAPTRAALESNGAELLSHTASTRIVTRAATEISLFVDPHVILGDGISTGTLSAVVTDALGNPVENDTQVRFAATQGTFADTGTSDVTKATTGGEAEAVLVAPLLAGFEPVYIPVVVTAHNPGSGAVTRQINIRFSPGAVVGRLLDSATRLPETGVEVRLVQNGQTLVTAYTDQNGFYQLIAPAIGTYEVEIVRRQPSGETEVIQMPTRVNEVNSAVTFGPSAIRGRLIDEATGEGVPNTPVELVDENGNILAEAVTDENGRYSFDQIGVSPQGQGVGPQSAGGIGLQSLVRPQSSHTRGKWTVRSKSPDGRTSETELEEPEPGDVLIELNLMVTPQGRVTDSVTGRPVAGARVELRWAGPPSEGQLVPLPDQLGVPQPNPKTTTGSGYYRFEVNPGYYRVYIHADGYLSHRSDPMVVQGSVVSFDVTLIPQAESDLAFEKRVTNTSAQPGDVVPFALRLENRARRALYGITVVDTLPTGLNLVPGSVSHGGVYASADRTITWRFDTLAPGTASGVSLRYDVEVQPVPDGTQLTNMATAQIAGRNTYAPSSVTMLIAKRPSMVITKTTQTQVASIGDIVRYTVSVKNENGGLNPQRSSATEIVDRLPKGFAYVPGSGRIEGPIGSRAVEPSQQGDRLVFGLGTMEIGDEATLTYAAGVTVEAAGTDGVNRAWVEGLNTGGFGYSVGPTQAATRVREGLFGSGGTLAGTVFIDRNGDGLQQRGEPGLSGAVIFMDNGRRITTGELGRYSLEELSPGVRSVLLDLASVPEGHVLRSTRSRFVTVPPTGIALADFALVPADTSPFAEDVRLAVTLGNREGKRFPVRIDVENAVQGRDRKLKLAIAATGSAGAVIVDVDVPDETVELPAGSTRSYSGWALLDESMNSGSLLVVASAQEHTEFDGASGTSRIGGHVLASAVERYLFDEQVGDAEAGEMRADLGSSQGLGGHPQFRNPIDGRITHEKQIEVEVQGALGSALTLWVNGEPIPADRIGRTEENRTAKSLTHTYYGVALAPGANRLEVRGRLEASEKAALHGITVYRVGEPAEIRGVAAPVVQPYDDERVVGLTLLVTDALGLPVADGTLVTLNAREAEVAGPDAQPGMLGAQVRTVGGTAPAELLVQPGTRAIEVRATSGKAAATFPVRVQQEAEPFLLAGSVDLALPLSQGSVGNAQGSFFYKRRLSSGVDILVGYDTRIENRDALRADGGPTAFQMRGDSSRSVDLTPSSDPFYLKVGKGRSYLQYGDFSTAWADGTRFTDRTGRETGFEFNVERGIDTLSGYAFAKRWTRKVDQLQALGITGPYFLSDAPVVQGSVEVWLRAILDAGLSSGSGAPEVEVWRRKLAVGKDYDVNHDLGTISFKEPVSRFDADLNPVLIEVSYAVPNGSPYGAVIGSRLVRDFGALRLGMTVTAETGSLQTSPFVFGFDGTLRLRTPFPATLRIEQAESANPSGSWGRAHSFELTATPSDSLNVRLRGQGVRNDFRQPGATGTLNPGFRIESTVDAALDANTRAQFEKSATGSWTGTPHHKDEFNVSFKLTPMVALRTGIESAGKGLNPFTKERTGAWSLGSDLQLGRGGRLSFGRAFPLTPGRAALDNVRYELALSERATAAVAYQERMTTGGKVAGDWLLSAENTMPGGTKVYGTYRIPGRVAEEANRAMLGLRHTFALGEGWKLGVSLEGTTEDTLDWSLMDQATSWSLEYVGSAEHKLSVTQDSVVNGSESGWTASVAADGALGSGLSYQLAFTRMEGTRRQAAERTLTSESVVGLSYRDPDGNRDTLFAQYVGRQYANPSGQGFAASGRHVDVFMLQWGRRLHEGDPLLLGADTKRLVTLSATTAWKRSQESAASVGSPEQSYGSNVYLAQVGVEIPIQETLSLEVYGRKLWDSFGGTLSGSAVEWVYAWTNDVGIGFGVSTLGTDDPDLRRVITWPKGVFTRLRLKF